MVFAAGLGTRLRPITDTTPKALVEVGGKPLLYHAICKLRKAGYDDIVVNVHHYSQQVIDYLAHNDLGVKTAVSDESALLLETGGGIKHARPLLEPLTGPFLVHNVDILSNLDLGWFRAQARPDALSTLLVSRRETSRYLLFDTDMRLRGWTNVKTGEVRSPYPAEELEACMKFAFAGIHNISPAVFAMMENYPERFPIMDFYLGECSNHPIYGVVADNLQMIDVGKLDSLKAAEEFYASFAKNFQ